MCAFDLLISKSSTIGSCPSLSVYFRRFPFQGAISHNREGNRTLDCVHLSHNTDLKGSVQGQSQPQHSKTEYTTTRWRLGGEGGGGTWHEL